MFNPLENHRFGREKGSPNEFFNFNPPYPCTAVLEGGVGSKLLCIMQLLCVNSDLGPAEELFSYMDPITWGPTPGTPSRLPPPPPNMALAGEDLSRSPRLQTIKTVVLRQGGAS